MLRGRIIGKICYFHCFKWKCAKNNKLQLKCLTNLGVRATVAQFSLFSIKAPDKQRNSHYDSAISITFTGNMRKTTRNYY